MLRQARAEVGRAAGSTTRGGEQLGLAVVAECAVLDVGHELEVTLAMRQVGADAGSWGERLAVAVTSPWCSRWSGDLAERAVLRWAPSAATRMQPTRTHCQQRNLLKP